MEIQNDGKNGGSGSRSLLTRNSKLSEIEKFTYLRSLVEGNAESAIAGLPLTSANYKGALEILQNRFAQKQVIINAHYGHITEFRACSFDGKYQCCSKGC